jgi:hypothetical protein
MADENSNTGYLNTGDRNTGNRNTGNRNTGNLNTGNLNTGNLNTGYRNTGDLNTGNRNTGNRNTGNRNTGNLNTGNLNTGNLNTGYRNTGDLNTGNLNTGSRNTGYLNTGSLNTGNRNTGYLNTGDGPVTFFGVVVPGLSWEDADRLVPWIDLPSFSCEWVDASMMTDEEKAANASHKTIGGFLRKYDLTIQQSFPLAWAKLNSEEKKRWNSLPNFNADMFLACTGVDVRLDADLYKQPMTFAETEPCKPKQVVIDGITYNLTPA